jgi:uncharacterized Zn ribbon protein
MSDLNVNRPECGCENAYHNGVNYECRDCGHEWGGLN